MYFLRRFPIVLVGDNGVFFKEISFSVSGSNGGGAVTNNDGTGSGKIKASGDNILDSGGDSVVLESDISDEIDINGTKPSSSGSESASGKIKVRIKKAGQSDVEAL